MNHQTAILLLAAGESLRLGEAKQLLDIDGEPLVRRVARQLVEMNAGPVGVVLGARRDAICPALDGLALSVIENPDFARGLGTSIAAGIRWAETLAVEAALIVLCDQPAIDTSHLWRLIARLGREVDAVGTGYGGSIGVPAMFHRTLFARLGQLPPDRGAKELLTDPRVKVADVPCESAAIDLDTPGDVERWRAGRRDGSYGSDRET